MIEVRDAQVSFGGREQADVADGEPTSPAIHALQGVSCTFRTGEVVALVGANGSGKSTLVNLLCGAMLAHPGMVRVEGLDPAADEVSRREVRRLVGHVFQSPADQMVSTVVGDEVAFGPRNLGLEEREVETRVGAALATVGLAGCEAREVEALSGGEQQRLAIASVLAMEPRFLLLDEATAQLDSASRPALRTLFCALAHERGMGVIQVTHDPIEVLMSDRVLVLEQGCVVWEGAPFELLLSSGGLWDRTLVASRYIDSLRCALSHGYRPSGTWAPEQVVTWLTDGLERSGDTCSSWVRDLMRATGVGGAYADRVDGPARAADGRGDGSQTRASNMRGGGAQAGASNKRGGGVQTAGVQLQGVSYSYGMDAALDDVTLDAAPGEVLLVAGATGSGKSTLGCVVAGLYVPSSGHALVDGRTATAGMVGVAFQNPERQMFLGSVADEIAFAPRNAGVAEDDLSTYVTSACEVAGVADELLPRDPFSLSGGQARRVAVASILAQKPRAYVFDEPTSGLDAAGRADMHRVVRTLAYEGAPVIVVSHDLEEWLEVADRVVLLRSGEIAWSGTVTELSQDRGAFGRAGLAAPEAWTLRWCVEDVCAGIPAASTSDEVADVRRPKASSVPDSLLHRVDTRVKIGLLMAATIAIFATPTPLALAVWVLVLLGVLAAGSIGPRRAVRALRPVVALLVLVVCANLISCDGSAQIMLAAPFGLSLAGAWRAGGAVMRIVLLVGLALAVSDTSTPTQLADACVRLMRPLRRVGVPVGPIGLVLSLSLRFIPLAMDEVSRINLAQRSRGVRFDEGGLVHRIRLWGAVLVPAVVSLFRRADRVAESMDARCYEEASRSDLPPRPLTGLDRATLAVGAAVIVAIVVGTAQL
ncbi:energy-coupling factor transporter ATPase [Collinsella sp. An2]|uniref:energy-coupling factor transporter ATPase n=1 Tax=Collinsella sp. An2 TaxID=1965585 RepID=UPI000B365F8E|nr:energy-coupling factor transporter ATPase [Collinsella sp. An2]OUP07183.1 hypothetical protein B5F33_09215 [Collinsella sp. An2]